MILCPFVSTPDLQNNRLNLQEATREFVKAHDGKFFDVSASDFEYHRVLSENWNRGEDLVIVEQDVVPAEEAFEEMLGCVEPWCGCPYNIGGQQAICLGCTRFSLELQEAFPDLLRRAAELTQGDRVPHRWCYLDTSIDQILRQEEGLTPHAHGPAVHIKQY